MHATHHTLSLLLGNPRNAVILSSTTRGEKLEKFLMLRTHFTLSNSNHRKNYMTAWQLWSCSLLFLSRVNFYLLLIHLSLLSMSLSSKLVFAKGVDTRCYSMLWGTCVCIIRMDDWDLSVERRKNNKDKNFWEEILSTLVNLAKWVTC